MFCVSTEVLWRNKIRPHFQLLPMSKVDQGPELQCLLKVEEDLSNAQVTHSRTGRRISHGYNPASFVAICIGP